jgi:DNA-binding NarL/FixJ family response regulator
MNKYPKATERPIELALNRREKQVIGLICQAKENKEIACELHLSEGTVKEYLCHIYRKLHMTNRTELAVWAFRRSAEK